MSDPTIGIKIANGSYYPILQENKIEKKKLTLTTVNDNQDSVQIDLYKGLGETIENSVYIGSLIIENIEQAEKGAPEIELLLGIDTDGNLNADAIDKATGESQSLSVSLESLSENSMYEIPDFELNDEDPIPLDKEMTFDDSTKVADFDSNYDKPENKKSPAMFWGFLLVSIGILFLLIMLVFNAFSKGEEDPLLAKDKAPKAVPEAQMKAVPEKITVEENVEEKIEKEIVKVVPPQKIKDDKINNSSPKGILYRIKRGDTLWDISESVYRDPWSYGSIATDNDIANPDLIFEGNKIFIKEK